MPETLIKKSESTRRGIRKLLQSAFYRVLGVKCRISICENPPLHTGISPVQWLPTPRFYNFKKNKHQSFHWLLLPVIDILIKTTIGLQSLLTVEQFLQRWESIILKRAHWSCVSTMLSMICWLFPRCWTWLSVVSMAQSQSGFEATRWLLAWVESSNPLFPL